MKAMTRWSSALVLLMLTACAYNPALIHQTAAPEDVAVKFWEYNFHQEFEKAYYLLGRDLRQQTSKDAYMASMKLLFIGLATAYGNNNQQFFKSLMKSIKFKAVETKLSAVLAKVKVASDLSSFLVFTTQDKVEAMEKDIGYFNVILSRDELEGWRIQMMDQQEEEIDENTI